MKEIHFETYFHVTGIFVAVMPVRFTTILYGIKVF